MSALHNLKTPALALCMCVGRALGEARAQEPAASNCTVPSRVKPALIPTTDPSNHLLYSYNELQYLSCDFDRDVSTVFDLSEQQFKASSKTWVYSLMASNVYREKGQVFVIPGWEVASRWKSPSGLTFEEWTHKDSGGKPDQIVVAFEGTKFSSLDDWQTNLSLIEPRQFREAYAYMDCLVKHRANGARIAVTGHSLGGALALNMSLRLPGIHAYVFDPSPRAFFKVKMKKVKADMRAGVAPERILVYESGEVLAFVRAPWQAAFRNFERYRFNFMDFTNFFAVVSEHNMYLIARGLLMAAIKAKDAQAGQAFTANLSSRDLEDAFKEEKEPGDKKYDIGRCQWIFQTYPVR